MSLGLTRARLWLKNTPTTARTVAVRGERGRREEREGEGRGRGREREKEERKG